MHELCNIGGILGLQKLCRVRSAAVNAVHSQKVLRRNESVICSITDLHCRCLCLR